MHSVPPRPTPARCGSRIDRAANLPDATDPGRSQDAESNLGACDPAWFNLAVRVLIVGCGYVGLPLGAELVRQGHEVVGVRRSVGAEPELKAAGIQPAVADVT